MPAVSGRVFFDPDRVGEFFTGAVMVGGIIVRAFATDNTIAASGSTGVDGTFELTVPDGAYEIAVVPPQGWAPVCAGGTRRYDIEVDVNPASGLDFALQRVQARFRRVQVWSHKPA